MAVTCALYLQSVALSIQQSADMTLHDYAYSLSMASGGFASHPRLHPQDCPRLGLAMLEGPLIGAADRI